MKTIKNINEDRAALFQCAFEDTDTTRLQEVAGAFARYAEEFEINTPLRIAHFLGQIGHETSFGNTPPFEALRESCFYRENTLRNNAWGTRYCHLYEGFIDNNLDDCNQSCTSNTALLPVELRNLSFDQITNSDELRNLLSIKDEYLQNGMDNCVLMDLVYSCRNGNGSPSSGDGSRYRGAGLIHLTWENNYEQASEWWNEGLPPNSPDRKDFTGADFDDFFNNIDVSMKVAMLYWENRNINNRCIINGTLQENNDCITEQINGENATRNSRQSRLDNSLRILNCINSIL